MERTRTGALMWALCAQYFVGEAVAIAGWPGHYSLSANYISDLGAIGCGAAADPLICSPLHAVMNASFVLQGVLITGGTILARPLFPRGAGWLLALLLIAVSGLGVFAVGLFPEDAAPSFHYAGALVNFSCCNLGMAVLGAVLARRPDTRAMGLATLTCGCLGLLGLGCLGAEKYFGLGVGGMERVTAYPFPLWISCMGIMLLRRGRVGGIIAA